MRLVWSEHVNNNVVLGLMETKWKQHGYKIDT